MKHWGEKANRMFEQLKWPGNAEVVWQHDRGDWGGIIGQYQQNLNSSAVVAKHQTQQVRIED